MPAKAVCQSLNLQLDHRYRMQASSHTGHALPKKNQRLAQIPVGAGLLAKALCQSLNIQLSHRYRRQASSHRFWGGGWRSSFDAVVEGVAHCRYGNSLAIDDSRLVAKSIGRRQ